MMKRIIYLLALTTLMACKKEDPTPVKANEFTINSDKYNIDEGWVENWGLIDATTYNVDLTLVSSGISPLIEDGIIDYFAGKGNMIYLEMYTNVPNSHQIGTYQFSDSMKPNTFDLGYVLTNYDFGNDSGDIKEVIDGSAKIINVEKNTIEVEVNLTTNDNKNIKGYFKGKTVLYDYSEIANVRIKNAIVKKSKKRGFKL